MGNFIIATKNKNTDGYLNDGLSYNAAVQTLSLFFRETGLYPENRLEIAD